MPIQKFIPDYQFQEEKINQLKQIFPEAFADGKINWEVLKDLLSTQLEDEDRDAEHFGLFWPGKREARKAAAIPSKGALIPCPGEGIDEENTGNIFIEGENLEVLKLLQKSYAGRIKMIYIDPPYNTGNDFIYEDNFTEPIGEYFRRTGQVDEEGTSTTTNKKSDGRFHSKWLSMMYPRIKIAFDLLDKDGVIFVSIDDSEVHNLKQVMNELCGEENFVCQFVWSGGRKNDSKLVSVSHEYVLAYIKDVSYFQENAILWRQRKKGIDEIYSMYEKLKKKYGDDCLTIEKDLKNWFKGLKNSHPAKHHKHYSCVDKRGIYFPDNISWPGGGGPKYSVIHPKTRKPVKIPSRGWMFSDPQKMEAVIKDDRVHFGPDENSVPCIKSYLKDREYQVPYSVFYQDGRASTKRLRTLMGGDYFDHPKDEEILKEFIEFAMLKDGICMDFFAGSSTTSHSVFEFNIEQDRNINFISIQLPELVPENSLAYKAGYRNLAEYSKERIRRVSKKLSKENPGTKADLGFKVFKLDHTHFKQWKDFPGTQSSQLETLFTNFEIPLRHGWKPENLITEIIIQEGFPLDSVITQVPEITQNTVRIVSSAFCRHRLHICLDAKITDATISQIRFNDGDIFICLDSAITNDHKITLADKGIIKTI